MEKISFNVRKETGIEIVGDTKIRVNVEDAFEDYIEIFDDEVGDEILKEIDTQIKEDYLEESNPTEILE